MFGLFRKQPHEPVVLQLRDLDIHSNDLRAEIASGEDCDVLSGATGEFGKCATNPIPVNGILGTFKYLAKLRSSSGRPLFFHRIGSVQGPVANSSVDVYETVSNDGRYWDILYLHMYHPPRSNEVPNGYTLMPYDKSVGDLPFAFGVSLHLREFPFDLPDALAKSNTGGPAFALRAREHLAQANFKRPQTQVKRP